MAQRSLIPAPVPGTDQLTAWMNHRGICEVELRDGLWSGRQEKTSLMFAGVPEDPRETLLSRLDAALAEAKAGPAEGKGEGA